jgi:Domain of unknown function (DUF397)
MTNYSAHRPTTSSVPESAWFKSSYSGQNNGNCVEVAVQLPKSTWLKSSYSGANGGNCVEVAAEPSAVHVRDSKDKQGPSLSFTPQAWAAFAAFAAAQDPGSGATGV